MSEEKEFYQDYRFFVKAENGYLAAKKLMEWLPWTDEEVHHYASINIISEFHRKDE